MKQQQAQHVVETPAGPQGNAELTGSNCPTICPTLVKERPILFSGEMVRAILAGNKTQTRRVVKPQPKSLCVGHCPATKPCFTHDGLHCMPSEYCPYGRVGDRLWVRETWKVGLVGDATVLDFAAGGYDLLDYPVSFGAFEQYESKGWRPSIHMPRWASRITLEITGVRVERLQDITWADIRYEGVECPLHDFPGGLCVGECRELRQAFRNLWDSINGKSPGKTWDDNPWVWVIEFKKVPQ